MPLSSTFDAYLYGAFSPVNGRIFSCGTLQCNTAHFRLSWMNFQVEQRRDLRLLDNALFKQRDPCGSF